MPTYTRTRKYAKIFEIISNLFFPERPKVISAIKSQFEKKYRNKIIKKSTVEKSYIIRVSYGGDC